jgi:tetratricopeptide (TPR) repeat protein
MWEKAEKMYNILLERYRDCGQDDNVYSTWRDLGVLYRAQGRFKPAMQMMEQALVGYEKVFGHEDSITLDLSIDVAMLHHGFGNHQMAESIPARALPTLEKILGRMHEKTRKAMRCLAVAYYHQGRTRDAEELLKEALRACYQTKKNPRDNEVLDTLGHLAVCKLKSDHCENAEQLLRQILHGHLNDSGLLPRPPRGTPVQIIRTLHLLYEEQQRWNDAESLGEWIEENTKYHPLHKRCRIRRWEICKNAVLRFCEHGSTAKKRNVSEIS